MAACAIRAFTVFEDLDVVGARVELHGVRQGAGLEVGDQFLVSGVDVDRQARYAVQYRHRGLITPVLLLRQCW